jgi:crotonobetainyl-CoA:carnitine CoA-transferase CaiB-like acyl-CoA transferase
MAAVAGNPREGRPRAALEGLRIVECTAHATGAVSLPLIDLGAEVIKIEATAGDPVRRIGPEDPAHGGGPMHLHLNRGKSSVVLDLDRAEDRETFIRLIAQADGFVNGLKPGSLERRGITASLLRARNPRLAMVHVSGFGRNGPLRDAVAHGTAIDAWAGLLRITHDAEGHCQIDSDLLVGINVGPLFAAVALLAGIIAARTTGEGGEMEVAHADCAAGLNWQVMEAAVAEPGLAAPLPRDLRNSSRHQAYESADGVHVLLMAESPAEWERFCEVAPCPHLLAAGPARGHAMKDEERLRTELAAVFRRRTSAEWWDLAARCHAPVIVVNAPERLLNDRHFAERNAFLDAGRFGAQLMSTPIVSDAPVHTSPAPALNEHSPAVQELLGL